MGIGAPSIAVLLTPDKGWMLHGDYIDFWCVCTVVTTSLAAKSVDCGFLMHCGTGLQLSYLQHWYIIINLSAVLAVYYSSACG